MLVYVRTLSGVVDCLFFFFQAEDGIRDLTVTGVQTCALPIAERSRVGPGERANEVVDLAARAAPVDQAVGGAAARQLGGLARGLRPAPPRPRGQPGAPAGARVTIGRGGTGGERPDGGGRRGA